MGNEITVMVTGAGAPGIMGTIYSLRTCDKDIKLVATDIKDDVIGKYFCDSFYKVTSPEDKEYISLMLQIALKENVKVILPQTTREIEVLAKFKSIFEKNDVKIVVSKYEAIKLANNKCKLLELSYSLDIPHPKFKIVNTPSQLFQAILDFGYPTQDVVIKPCFSYGSRGIRVITERHLNLEFLLNEKPNGLFLSFDDLKKLIDKKTSIPSYIVQEYLPGEEYTVDVFIGKYIQIAIPRRRVQIRSGISFENIIDMRKDLIEYSLKLSKNLGLEYCHGYQFKIDKNGIPKILECNPRVQGTMVTSTFAGFNMIYSSILEVLDKPVTNYPKIDDKIKFKRYWGGIGIGENDELIGRI